MINYGPDAGKLAVIVDVIDHNRVCALLFRFEKIHSWIRLSERRGVAVVKEGFVRIDEIGTKEENKSMRIVLRERRYRLLLCFKLKE